MLVEKVTRNIWLTRKEGSLEGPKFLVVCLFDLLEGGKPDTPIVAVDSTGAGVGETVLIVSGSSARITVGRPDVLVNTAIVGIISSKEINTNVLQQK